MVLVKMGGKPGMYTGDEHEAFRVLGQSYDVRVELARADAKRCRDAMRGKKHPDGLAGPILTIPGAIASAALRTFNEMYTEGSKKEFYCFLWHQYPDFRCSPQPKCPWCGKYTRKFKVAVGS